MCWYLSETRSGDVTAKARPACAWDARRRPAASYMALLGRRNPHSSL